MDMEHTKTTAIKYAKNLDYGSEPNLKLQIINAINNGTLNPEAVHDATVEELKIYLQPKPQGMYYF